MSLNFPSQKLKLKTKKNLMKIKTKYGFLSIIYDIIKKNIGYTG